MSFSRRQKAIIAALGLYWSGIFIATHIPQIPRWVGQIPVSDKTLHFTAYLFLSFLLYHAISPNRKVNWRKPAVWITLAVIVWYGAIDEWLQIYVGRHADVRDFFADLCGAMAGLVILSIFNFWSASLVLSAIGMFIFTNFYRAKPDNLIFINSTIFFFCAYGFFTALWLRYVHHFLPVKCPQGKWLFGALALPLGLLLAMEGFCALVGYSFNKMSFAASAAAMGIVVVVVYVYGLLTGKSRNNIPIA